MSGSPFTGRTLAWLIGLGLGSLLLGFILSIFSQDLFGEASFRADTYSRSAVGHHALVKLLEKTGVPVIVSRGESWRRNDSQAPLILIEPRLRSDDDEDSLRELMRNAGRVLVVLPKWEPIPALSPRGSIHSAELVRESELERLLNVLDIRPSALVRDVSSPRWTVPSQVTGVPDIDSLQLLREDIIDPIISGDSAVLLGRLEDSWDLPETLILSDPDLLSNHGLIRGDNAVVAMQCIDTFLRAQTGGPVFVDETMHGYASDQSVWRRMFRYPVVLATAQVLLILMALLWAGMGRFGSPRPMPEHLAAGKTLLISNTAQLLRFSGHSGQGLRTLFRDTLRELASELRAPSSLDRKEGVTWLQEKSQKRGVEINLTALASRVNALGRKPWEKEGKILRVACEIQEWKRKLLDVS